MEHLEVRFSVFTLNFARVILPVSDPEPLKMSVAIYSLSVKTEYSEEKHGKDSHT